MASLDSFKARKTLTAGGKTYTYYSLPDAEKNGLPGISKLPFSMKVLLENLLQFEDGRSVTKADIEAFVAWLTDKGKDLFDVLYAMRNWAERWAYDEGEIAGPAVRYTHRACGADVGTSTVCPGCGEPLRYGDLKGQPSAALRAEQAARAG